MISNLVLVNLNYDLNFHTILSMYMLEIEMLHEKLEF